MALRAETTSDSKRHENVASDQERLISLPVRHETAEPWPVSTGDPFDPARLRLDQGFVTDVGVKKALLTVPVRRPDKHSFFRVHPDPAHRLDTVVLELKEEKETYLVDPTLWPNLTGEIIPKTLFMAITRQGVVSILPVRLPNAEGRIDEWNRTLMLAAQMATSKWVRVSANMGLGAYEVCEATGKLPEPEWPDVSFHEILRIAFKEHFINAPDHPLLRKLRGEL